MRVTSPQPFAPRVRGRFARVRAAANEVKANEATILSPPGPAVTEVSSPSLKVRTWDTGDRKVALVVNGSYQPIVGTVRCAGCAPLEVNLGRLAHGYYVLHGRIHPRP